MNEFIAGLIGGTAGLVVGHPLDTIKAVMQTKSNKSMWKSGMSLYQESKFNGFFRGLSLPVLGYGFVNSIIFGVYGNVLPYIDGSTTKEPSLKAAAIAGSIAGFVGSIPNNPIEIIKLQLQTHNSKEINGVISCAKLIIKRDGYMGFTRGLSLLISRDAPSYGLYFVSFELIRRELKNHYINSDIAVELIGGGIAGSLAWFSILPIDVVKSKIQASYSNNKNTVETFKSVKTNYGLKGYYRGLTPVLVRGFFVNAVTFCVWKRSLDYLNQVHVTKDVN